MIYTLLTCESFSSSNVFKTFIDQIKYFILNLIFKQHRFQKQSFHAFSHRSSLIHLVASYLVFLSMDPTILDVKLDQQLECKVQV